MQNNQMVVFRNTMYVHIHSLTLQRHFKLHSNGPLYSNTVIGTPAVDGWAATFGTATRGLGGLRPRPVPHSCTKCNSPPINGRCTNFIYSMWHLFLHHKGLNWTLTTKTATTIANNGHVVVERRAVYAESVWQWSVGVDDRCDWLKGTKWQH